MLYEISITHEDGAAFTMLTDLQLAHMSEEELGHWLRPILARAATSAHWYRNPDGYPDGECLDCHLSLRDGLHHAARRNPGGPFISIQKAG